MPRSKRYLLISALLLLLCPLAIAQSLPSDVRSNHWAAGAVRRVLQTQLLKNEADGKFHGEARVTRQEALTAIAKLAKYLNENRWKPVVASKPVPTKTIQLFDTTNWRTQPVRKYVFASTLTRFADYFANGVQRPMPGDATLAKSTVIPTVTIKLPSTHPAFPGLSYLAKNRMVQPGSPLLQPNNNDLTGAELSLALSQMAIGLNNLVSPLGKTEDGNSTLDAGELKRLKDK